ncbi:MAG: GNAT family N-acetyltransferase [Clostridia bacterium]|nr:GNAT family N-acetyltransferase [Clostridia bacterium]
MRIRPVEQHDLPLLSCLWNACAEAGEVLYAPLTEEAFCQKFDLTDPDKRENLLVADTDGQAVGMIHGVTPESFPLAQPGNAYLTCLLVGKAYRGQGIGQALLNALKVRMKALGGQRLIISNWNPVNLAWRVPGTPGHDHNNAPGVDTQCAGYGFFPRSGFHLDGRQISMYIDLSTYHMSPTIRQIQEKLLAEGIYTGVYDPQWNCGYDALCDRVGSDYWRDVLRTEIAAWNNHEPNQDKRMWADGIRPSGPRPLLTAVHDGQIVGFTGPVDLQKSGRGWFTGICTDPTYGGKGIATVLFNLLMQAFVDEGARFSTLFTGSENHAQKIYLRAGLRPVREFAMMTLPL